MEHRSINLTLEDGREITCEVLTLFKVGEQTYIALVKPDEDYVLLYRFTEDEEGPILENIESDEEFAKAEKIFREVEKELVKQHNEHSHHHDHGHPHEGCCGHGHSDEENEDSHQEGCCGSDNSDEEQGCGCS